MSSLELAVMMLAGFWCFEGCDYFVVQRLGRVYDFLTIQMRSKVNHDLHSFEKKLEKYPPEVTSNTSFQALPLAHLAHSHQTSP